VTPFEPWPLDLLHRDPFPFFWGANFFLGFLKVTKVLEFLPRMTLEPPFFPFRSFPGRDSHRRPGPFGTSLRKGFHLQGLAPPPSLPNAHALFSVEKRAFLKTPVNRRGSLLSSPDPRELSSSPRALHALFSAVAFTSSGHDQRDARPFLFDDFFFFGPPPGGPGRLGAIEDLALQTDHM